MVKEEEKDKEEIKTPAKKKVLKNDKGEELVEFLEVEGLD